MDEELYLSAERAAKTLGVSVKTLYAYVSRKNIRSRPVPGSRQRRYWRADVEQIAGVSSPQTPSRPGGLSRDTDISLITDQGPHYRGHSAVSLAEHAALEDVAALLWQADRQNVFTDVLPNQPAMVADILRLFSNASAADRALAVFPMLELANPRAYDLTHAGMAATGQDVVRWLAALLTKADGPSTDPIHLTVARRLGASDDMADLIRRVLVLSADHGFEPGTYAVRAVASAGVTPYRSVLTGLSVAMGRRTRVGRFDGLARLLNELAEAPDPHDPIVRRIREGEQLPGFGSNLYQHGDPRARAVLARLDELVADDAEFRKLRRAIDVVRDIQGLDPDFALMSFYVARRVGLDPRDSLFSLGRAVGWVAHSIEQYQVGGVIREPSLYKGPLPEIDP